MLIILIRCKSYLQLIFDTECFTTRIETEQDLQKKPGRNNDDQQLSPQIRNKKDIVSELLQVVAGGSLAEMSTFKWLLR